MSKTHKKSEIIYYINYSIVFIEASEKMHLSENLFRVVLYVALMKHQHSFHVVMYFRGKDIEGSLELICHLPAFITLCKLFWYSVLRVPQWHE